MIIRQPYPILEFDDAPRAKIEPGEHIQTMDIPACCVITFFREVIEKKLAQDQLQQVACLRSETVDLPVYRTLHHGKPVCLVTGFVGAPGAAGQLEELIAMGCGKFIICGGAGVLQKDIAVGHLVVPDAALRDEGTSYHYLPPAREVPCNPEALRCIEQALQDRHIPYLKGKTWTTDALYRETEEKVALRVSEGYVTVEMEAAAFFAVARFRKVTLGQILYGGDDLSGAEWDGRGWNSRALIRENLVDLAMDICLDL